MALLRAEMERRLKEQQTNTNLKISRLADQCERLQPGEAAQILIVLDDRTVASILNRMDRQKAIPVAAVLARLGREKAISFQ